MSFWGATVITSFFIIIPVIGKEVVMWIWGGFTYSDSRIAQYMTFYVRKISSDDSGQSKKLTFYDIIKKLRSQR